MRYIMDIKFEELSENEKKLFEYIAQQSIENNCEDSIMIHNTDEYDYEDKRIAINKLNEYGLIEGMENSLGSGFNQQRLTLKGFILYGLNFEENFKEDFNKKFLHIVNLFMNSKGESYETIENDNSVDKDMLLYCKNLFMEENYVPHYFNKNEIELSEKGEKLFSKLLNIKIFISYSHDDDISNHKDTVCAIADYIKNFGIKVNYDKQDSELGKDLNEYMIENCNNQKVIMCICSKNYVDKYQNNTDCGSTKELKEIEKRVKERDEDLIVVEVFINNKNKDRIPFFGNSYYIDLNDITLPLSEKYKMKIKKEFVDFICLKYF